jgi:hypothetical protein
MTHDPYQTYPTFMTNPGLGNPFTSGINPIAYNPLAAQQLGAQGIQGIQGVPNYGGVPQQWYGASQNPFAGGFQNPALQNPFGNAGQQNPFLAAAIQNPLVAYALQMQSPLLNPLVAQLASQLGAQIGYQPYSPFQQGYPQQHQMGHAALGQQISPFAQFNPQGGQFNPQLAPQSWVGQGIGAQVGQLGGYGQANPLLAQLAARALQGVSPWSAF